MVDYDWRADIGTLIRMKSEMHGLDVASLWRYAFPRVGASPLDLDEAEARIGFPLEDQHRSFLSYADGWPAVYHDVGLLGTGELGRGSLWEEGIELLRIATAAGHLKEASSETDSFPIAVSRTDTDVFAMKRRKPPSSQACTVVWIATGQMIQQFDDFRSFWSAILELNTRDMADLVRDARPPHEAGRVDLH